MSDLTMHFQGYAPGAIKTRAQLLDVVIEARKEKKAIRLYTVEQAGYQSEIYLTSKSKVFTNDSGFDSLTCWSKSGSSRQRYYRYDRCLFDLNITDRNGRNPGHNRHQLFLNRRHADAYGAALRNDATYHAAVKRWHEKCNRLFEDMGW